MDESSKATKKARSKPSLATSAVKTDATPVKRKAGSEKNTKKESKRVKRKLADVDEGTKEETPKKTVDDSKKQLFQRLWSEEDEIVILKGMIEYAKKGAEPVADIGAFHEFLKNSLHIDVSNTQLSDKVRRMKKKYENNVRKSKNGKDRTFSNPHEQKAYELSKKIWGKEANGVGNDTTKVNGKAKNQNPRASVDLPKVDELGSPDRKNKATKTETRPNTGMPLSLQFNRGIGMSSSEEEIIKRGWDLISDSQKSELEEKWKKLRVEEIEHFLKQVDLMYEQTKLVLEAFKSSGN